MNIDSLEAHIDSDDGYCTACKAWTNFGGCEPDARNYVCDECGKRTVFGAEEAALMGLVEASEEDEEQAS
jgi:hypothetical protein